MNNLDGLYSDMRERFFSIWEQAKEGLELEGEDKFIAEFMQLHTEFHDIWNNPDEMMHYRFDPDTEVNPFLHITLDLIITNQITQEDPPETKRAYEKLLKKGISHHDAIHKIAAVLAEEIYHMSHEGRPFDLKRYTRNLMNELV